MRIFIFNMVMTLPQFPYFKPLDLEDRQFIHGLLWNYQSEMSEITFTNLFIWRAHYGFQWSVYKDWFFLICTEIEGGLYAFPPIGPPSRKEAAVTLLEWLRDENRIENPRIDRADKRLCSEFNDTQNHANEPLRDHFDYVYRREDLVRLAGSRYRSKRNHINQFLRFYTYVYEPLEDKHIDDCLVLQEKWCKMNRCKEDLDLLGEHEAIREVLTHHNALQVCGAVILVDGRVGAFTLGEKLNDDTAVIHIEKADPEIPGLYPLINQQFCENRWQDITYINREQDLGIPGLREAKLSYYPDHFVEKFRIKLL
jgi:hypothetical protein